MLADDNLGEKLVNIGLPLAQSSLKAFAAIEVTTISIWRLLSLMVRWQMLCRSRICQICRTRRSGEIESVHIVSAAPGRQLARLMIQWTIEQCRVRKCHLVQLSSDTARINAKLAISLVNLQSSNSKGICR